MTLFSLGTSSPQTSLIYLVLVTPNCNRHHSEFIPRDSVSAFSNNGANTGENRWIKNLALTTSYGSVLSGIARYKIRPSIAYKLAV
jgi:hypothetical protein